MESLAQLLTTVGIFVAAIFILVMIHELGHFLAARLFGMRVERFSIGFPPRVWGIQRGDTDYCISATPLGGYVKISGMIDESLDTEHLAAEPQPWEFRSKPVWQRAVVISAGVIFNVILAWVIYTGIIFAYGDSFVPAAKVGALYIPEGSLAAETGFQTGDRLVSVNGAPIADFNADVFNLKNLTSNTFDFTVERNGTRVEIVTQPGFLDKLAKSEEPLFSLVNALPAQVGEVVGGGPAEKAGLQRDDRVIRFNETPIAFWMQFVPLIKQTEGTAQLTVVRGADTLLVAVTPDPEKRTIGVGPVNFETYFGIEFRQYSVFKAAGMAFVRTGETMAGIVGGLKQMVSGSISVKDNVGGPIAIAKVTRQATESGGMRGFWMITAYLSVTLAIMNLLPLPVLDGGHLVFLAWEGITRREPSVKVRMYLQQAGLVFFILMFLFVTYNDVLKLF
jgi:regulator of sigma E protease